MKRYLITGASGFVAFHFINYLNLIHDNCEVLAIDISIPNDTENYLFNNINLSFIELNLLDYQALESAIISYLPTHIIHLASFSSVAESWLDPISSFMNNTNIFLYLAEIIRKNNIKCRFLSVGSSEEYGNVSVDSIPLRESMLLNPVSPYAIARVSQEMLSQCYVSSYNLDIILTRSFNHIGTRQREVFVIPSLVKQVLEEIKTGLTSKITLFTGDVSIIRDFLDVRDVVKVYYLLLEYGITGQLYNVCSGVGISIKEIIDKLSALLSIHINIEIDKNKIRPNDNKIIIGDNSKIVKLTGWQPEFSIEDSLNDIIVYWKKKLQII